VTVATGGSGSAAAAFDELVVSNERRLLRLALMLSGGVHTAEDLVQTVLARAHRRWDRISALEYPEAYLRTMVVNEFLSWRRRLKNNELPMAEIAGPGRGRQQPTGAARRRLATAGDSAAAAARRTGAAVLRGSAGRRDRRRTPMFGEHRPIQCRARPGEPAGRGTGAERGGLR
jgi:DNA-directed RNA polymerase specialized sigma24 family protein